MYSENLSNIVIDLMRNYEGHCRGSDTVGLSVRPVRGRLGVRIPAVTKKVVNTCSDSSTAKRLALSVSVTGPRR